MSTTYPVRWYQHSHGFAADGRSIRERESFLLIHESGTVEGWRTPLVTPQYGSTHYGGVEIHSKGPAYDGHAPLSGCQWTGGDCYHDGSSMAFDRIEWYFDSPDLMFEELSSWAQSHLGIGDPA